MIVYGYYDVFLPVKLYIENEFYKTKLTKFDFTLDKIDCKLVLSGDKTYIERILLKIPMDYEDSKYPIWELDSNNHYIANKINEEYSRDFISEMDFMISTTLQNFLDGFSKASNHLPYRIHDGESIITKYNFHTEPAIMGGGYSGDNEHTQSNTISDEELVKAIEYVHKSKTHFDLVWQIFLDIETYIETGKLEVVILQLATILEVLIINELKEYLDDYGNYVDKPHTEMNNRKKFHDKYYIYGFKILGYTPLSEELLNSIEVIYDIRNKVMHRGSRLSEIPIVKNSNISPAQYKNVIWGLRNDCVEIHNIIKEYNE